MSPRVPDTQESFASEPSLESLVENTTTERKTRLIWGSVQIREYNRIVGDNPGVSVGPPLTLDWDYYEHEPIGLTDYEETRQKRKNFWRLRLSSVTRRNMLKNVFGISDEEIAAAEKGIEVIRKKRELTAKQSKLSTSVETAFQSARRKIRKRFSKENVALSLSTISGPFVPLQHPHRQ